MALIRRQNVELTIPDKDDVIEKYINDGFDLIDQETGKVIQKAVPKNAAAIEAEYQKLLEENKKLKAQIKKLKAAAEEEQPKKSK